MALANDSCFDIISTTGGNNIVFIISDRRGHSGVLYILLQSVI